MMRSFSIREVILVAVVSFVVSGLGGALLNAYLNRAKLTLTVTSLGFEGGFVEVDDELIKASENDDWGVPFERFVDFRTLLAREKASSEMVLRLQAAQQHVDRWLTPITTDEAQEVLTKTEVRRSPYLGSETTVMGSSIPVDFPEMAGAVTPIAQLRMRRLAAVKAIAKQALGEPLMGLERNRLALCCQAPTCQAQQTRSPAQEARSAEIASTHLGA